MLRKIIYEYLSEEAHKIKGNLCHDGRFVPCDATKTIRDKRVKAGKKVAEPPKWTDPNHKYVPNPEKNKDLTDQLGKMSKNGNIKEMVGSDYDIDFSGKTGNNDKNAFVHTQFKGLMNDKAGYSDTIENLTGINPEQPFDGDIEMGMNSTDTDNGGSEVMLTLKMNNVKSKDNTDIEPISVTHNIKMTKNEAGDIVSREAFVDDLDMGILSTSQKPEQFKKQVSHWKDTMQSTIGMYDKIGVSKIHTQGTAKNIAGLGFSVSDPKQLKEIHGKMLDNIDKDFDEESRYMRLDEIPKMKKRYDAVKKLVNKFKDDPALPVKIAKIKTKSFAKFSLAQKALKDIEYEGAIDLNSTEGKSFKRIINSKPKQ